MREKIEKTRISRASSRRKGSDLIKNIALFALFFSLVSLLGREGVLNEIGMIL